MNVISAVSFLFFAGRNPLFTDTHQAIQCVIFIKRTNSTLKTMKRIFMSIRIVVKTQTVVVQSAI